MSTAPAESPRPRGDAGFTLIEVLVAMVILAVGLLALEALGIVAATSVARADRQSELTIGATHAMESATQAVRQNPASPFVANGCRTDERSRLYTCTTVETRNTSPGLTPQTARITVTVSREADQERTLTISSYVFHPQLP